MNKLSLIAFAAAFATAPAAMAQDSLVVVDLSDISAGLATELNIDVADVPTTIELAADLAAEVCGIEVAFVGSSCVAIVSTADLLVAVENEADEGTGGPSANSAREFAPGQQDGPAKDHAPGQQDGSAKDSAPGQMKKNADSGDDATSQ